MESARWNIITPSQYEWERRGLDFIRKCLPDHDPYRAWATYVKLLSDMRDNGYRVVLFYLWLPSAEMAVARVANRVKQGGHNTDLF